LAASPGSSIDGAVWELGPNRNVHEILPSRADLKGQRLRSGYPHGQTPRAPIVPSGSAIWKNIAKVIKISHMIEQDRRGVKSRIASILGFPIFKWTAVTLTGIELLGSNAAAA
jgi:hypothetical protein